MSDNQKERIERLKKIAPVLNAYTDEQILDIVDVKMPKAIVGISKVLNSVKGKIAEISKGNSPWLRGLLRTHRRKSLALRRVGKQKHCRGYVNKKSNRVFYKHLLTHLNSRR